MILHGLNTAGGTILYGLNPAPLAIVVGVTDDAGFLVSLSALAEHAIQSPQPVAGLPMLLGFAPIGGSNEPSLGARFVVSLSEISSTKIASTPIEAAGFPMLLGVTAIGGETTSEDVVFSIAMEDDES